MPMPRYRKCLKCGVLNPRENTRCLKCSAELPKEIITLKNQFKKASVFLGLLFLLFGFGGLIWGLLLLFNVVELKPRIFFGMCPGLLIPIVIFLSPFMMIFVGISAFFGARFFIHSASTGSAEEEEDKLYRLREKIGVDDQLAEINFTKAIEEDPKNPQLYYFRGIVFKRMGKLEQAENDFKKALEFHSGESSRALYEIALEGVRKKSDDQLGK